MNGVNPLRAGIVSRPEDYRWNSPGYHVQTGNRDNFLSTDFGLKEFNVKSKKERIRRYRRYVYEAGAINRPDKMQAKVIDDKVVANERKNEFEISRISRFRHRMRYFTDSGIIGSKEFVFSNYQRFKHLFYSKHEKKPKPIKGLDGIYSLKRLFLKPFENNLPEFSISNFRPFKFRFQLPSSQKLRRDRSEFALRATTGQDDPTSPPEADLIGLAASNAVSHCRL